jgi:hypothetical protein
MLTRPGEAGLRRIIRATNASVPEPVARLHEGTLRAVRVPGEAGSPERHALVAADGAVLLTAETLVELALPTEWTEGCGP